MTGCQTLYRHMTYKLSAEIVQWLVLRIVVASTRVRFPVFAVKSFFLIYFCFFSFSS